MIGQSGRGDDRPVSSFTSNIVAIGIGGRYYQSLIPVGSRGNELARFFLIFSLRQSAGSAVKFREVKCDHLLATGFIVEAWCRLAGVDTI
jgi:hypothetical protein